MSRTKITIVIVLATLFTFVHYIYRLHQRVVVFCDVGQGAATLFQMGTVQVLIDTGPDGRVLSCLGKYIPYFDKTVDVVIISHDQKDHAGGLQAILRKYTVQNVFGPPLSQKPGNIPNYTEIQEYLTFSFDVYVFKIKKASQSSKKNESANVVSVYSPENLYFISSDISALELYRLMPPETSVCEIPHHGSKYGLSPLSLSLAHPTIAVISVGKNNVYGHPSKEALALLKAKKIPFLRTDLQGDIVMMLR